MELIFWSIVCGLAIYGLIDILIGAFMPLEFIQIMYERAIKKAHDRITRG